jgi:hypothetical protein
MSEKKQTADLTTLPLFSCLEKVNTFPVATWEPRSKTFTPIFHVWGEMLTISRPLPGHPGIL